MEHGFRRSCGHPRPDLATRYAWLSKVVFLATEVAENAERRIGQLTKSSRGAKKSNVCSTDGTQIVTVGEMVPGEQLDGKKENSGTLIQVTSVDCQIGKIPLRQMIQLSMLSILSQLSHLNLFNKYEEVQHGAYGEHGEKRGSWIDREKARAADGSSQKVEQRTGRNGAQHRERVEPLEQVEPVETDEPVELLKTLESVEPAARPQRR